MDLVTTISIVLGVLGVGGTIYYGKRSQQVERAFTRYVDLENEVQRLEGEKTDNSARIRELEALRIDVYRHMYEPKDRTFRPGDRVKLKGLRPDSKRAWISDHAVPGMTGIVVDYGPGLYEYCVYWSQADYEGQPVDKHSNRWQSFWVRREEIERIG